MRGSKWPPRTVTAPSGANPEIKATAKEVNAFARRWARRLIARELEFIPQGTITDETFGRYGWGDAEVERLDAVGKSGRDSIGTVLVTSGEPPVIIPLDEWPTFKAVFDEEIERAQRASCSRRRQPPASVSVGTKQSTSSTA